MRCVNLWLCHSKQIFKVLIFLCSSNEPATAKSTQFACKTKRKQNIPHYIIHGGIYFPSKYSHVNYFSLFCFHSKPLPPYALTKSRNPAECCLAAATGKIRMKQIAQHKMYIYTYARNSVHQLATAFAYVGDMFILMQYSPLYFACGISIRLDGKTNVDEPLMRYPRFEPYATIITIESIHWARLFAHIDVLRLWLNKSTPIAK